jgi:LysR family transcriptional activator of nhaA
MIGSVEWLNYHHLLYFWLVAREGGLAPAAQMLRLSPPTVSAQIHALEDALGEALFFKEGRRLALTEMGRVVYRYAEEIFTLGRELQDAVKGRPTGRPVSLTVGIADAVPKIIARRLLQPAQELDQAVRLVCREDDPERMLADLAVHALDAILTDRPASATPTASVRVFSHLLGESDVSLFATPKLASRLKGGFPDSLTGAPVLLPTPATLLRRMLEQYFESVDVRPSIVGEFDDSALLKAFAQDGVGFFASPSIIATEVEAQYGVKRFARLPKVRERFYALTAERRLKHPAVIAISEGAKHELFGKKKGR